MTFSRRRFIAATTVFASALAVGRRAAADAGVVQESDANALALGYKTDAGRVDRAKFPKFQAGQACANCQFFQGKTGAAIAPCAIFGGKQVAAKGWCSAYSKKA
ncbi:high-potential iron-sulfur protein [Burkholderia metallica]|uniref:High-potential iron-sulfur protein n=1 Tax=Burkholderia metallica TaxID=488729 RepID=A0ABT8PFH4_9BURK|nr:high-potential iron-sulfur protein [Burkholderia metallica]AOJ33638.1 High potential iron-sulfur protein [Burkholderia metallica]MCA8000229.1 high-potential iron-sulfur protein [Burkholderia metallica]MCA8018881.1 high-potential iron-sulfur protein [Burkholderia metallica]MDN7933826.1 high-potential iron-sulfur protein [Burkholderia metallica]